METNPPLAEATLAMPGSRNTTDSDTVALILVPCFANLVCVLPCTEVAFRPPHLQGWTWPGSFQRLCSTIPGSVTRMGFWGGFL